MVRSPATKYLLPLLIKGSIINYLRVMNLKLPNRQLLVAVDSGQLGTMALETADPVLTGPLRFTGQYPQSASCIVHISRHKSQYLGQNSNAEPSTHEASALPLRQRRVNHLNHVLYAHKIVFNILCTYVFTVNEYTGCL